MPIAYKMTTLRSMVDSVIGVPPLRFARRSVWYSYALRCTNGNRALSATGSSASFAPRRNGERAVATSATRSEERRVGKEWRGLGGQGEKEAEEREKGKKRERAEQPTMRR